MTATSKKRDEMDVLMDTLLAELMEMTDTQILEGQNPADVQALGLQMLGKAKAEASRRRLAAAREKVAAQRSEKPNVLSAQVTVSDARAFLRQAQNDARYTLAARGLDEMTDEDALRLYRQIMQLERRDDEQGAVE